METAEILDAARVGFAGLDAPPSAQEAAIENLSTWLCDPRFAAYRAAILALVEKARFRPLLDGFYRTLPFGTGGRRGQVGLGPNRFNPWTLTTSISGHAQWLRHTRGDGPIAIAIGYDVRRFDNLRGDLDREVVSPVDGLSSRQFAEIAAEVYAAHDITVFLPPSDGLLSTPELSFAVRDLDTDGGLVVSASHNHPDDNGIKFYHSHGGQLVPPFDHELGQFIGRVERVERMSLDRATANGLIRTIPSDLHNRYIQANIAISRRPSARNISIVFTPLHGTADTTVGDVLRAAGFPLIVEPSQQAPDGSFPTVPFKAPNPEHETALRRAIDTADAREASIVMGCDPDADRLGVAVRHNDSWVTLNGNEIASLVCHAALHRHAHTDPLVIKTEVTSSLVSRIAESHGARVIDHLLVGFKYIGEALFLLERKGRFGAIEGTVDCFAVGLEESHGVLLSSAIRDKDAAGGALVLAELAAHEASGGRSLVDVLNELMVRHGAVHNSLSSLAMNGATGRARMDAAMASLRSSPPSAIGDRTVVRMEDRQDELGTFGKIRSETDRASRNVLVFTLEKGARLIIRPSGTEPRCKIYVETTGDVGGDLVLLKRRLQVEGKALAHAFIHLVLDRIDLELPDWGLEISDLMSIEDRIQWCHELIPELQTILETEPDTAIDWMNQQLTGDTRRQLRPGIEAMARTNSDLGELLLPYFS